MRFVALGFLLGCSGCLSNFDQFVPKDGSTGGETGGGEAGPADSGTPCDASAGCLGTATTCGNNCRDAGAMCVAGCSNNGCRNNCMQTQSSCVGKCRSDCVGCTGNTNCTAPCTTAAGMN